MGHHGAHITGEEVFAFPEAEHERTAAPGADDHVGQLAVQHDNAIGADHLFERRPERLDEPPLGVLTGGVVVMFADQMGKHLGIGLGLENMAFPEEFLAQDGVIFDHAIVNERQFIALIKVRVRVVVGHFPVGGPAGVGNPDMAGGGRFQEKFGQIGDPAAPFAHRNVALMEHRHSGAVVSAVFESTQTVEENRNCEVFADISDDAAHMSGALPVQRERGKRKFAQAHDPRHFRLHGGKPKNVRKRFPLVLWHVDNPKAT